MDVLVEIYQYNINTEPAKQVKATGQNKAQAKPVKQQNRVESKATSNQAPQNRPATTEQQGRIEHGNKSDQRARQHSLVHWLAGKINNPSKP